MPKDKDHAEFLSDLADNHQTKLATALVKLENRIANLVAEAPLRDGALFDLEWAISARTELRNSIRKEYLEEIDKILRDYGGVANSATKMLKEYGDFTKLDTKVINRLKKMTFQGFEAIGDEYLEVVSKQVYEMTLTGTSFATAVSNVKESVGKQMGKHAQQQVHDSLMQFNASVNVGIGKQSGATRWKYVGSKDSANRSFCARHVGKIYTDEEISDIWSGSWAGKASGDPFIVRGGYNCRHHFRPVFEGSIQDEEKN